MTPRETWILENLAPGAARAIEAREGHPMTAAEAFAVLRAADPSRNASALSWIMQTLVRGGFRMEDAIGGEDSKVADTLRLFGEHRRHLAPVDRSLTRYASLADLYASVEAVARRRAEADEAALLASATGRERRRLERERAWRESVVLRDDEVCRIAVPLTTDAARWWGRGTRWCTSADRENMFTHYGDAPLVVVVLPGGERFQFHFEPGGEVQAMDERDAPIDRETCTRHWSALGPVLLWMAERGGQVLSLLPDEIATREMWRNAIEKREEPVVFLPRRFLDADMAETAVRAEPDSFRHLVSLEGDLPPADRDRLAELAVSLYGANLARLPEERRTAALCDRAVAQDPLTLMHVPDALRTRAMCRSATERNGYAIGHVPPRHRDEALFLAAVEAHADALRHVPESGMTPAVLRAALEKDGSTIAHVPAPMLTPALCETAALRSSRAFRYIPDGMLSEAAMDRILAVRPSAIRQVPERFVTRERLVSCLEKDALLPHAKSWLRCYLPDFSLPEGIATPELVAEIARRFPRGLRLVPARDIPAATVSALVGRDPELVLFMPRDALVGRHWREAIEALPVLRNEVPDYILWDIDFLAKRDVPRPSAEVAEVAEETPAIRWEHSLLDGLRERLPRDGSLDLPASVP